MAQAAQQFDPDPQRHLRLSSDEQRIANAVVAALRPELEKIIDTQKPHTKPLDDVQRDMRGVNKILAGEGLILDDPDI